MPEIMTHVEGYSLVFSQTLSTITFVSIELNTMAHTLALDTAGEVLLQLGR